MEEQKLLTLAEVAQKLDVSRQTIYRLHSKGLLSFIRLGAAIRISAEELARFIDASTQTIKQVTEG